MHTHIAILGTPTQAGNRGVRALGASLITLCYRATDDRAEIILFQGHHNGEPFPITVDSKRHMVPVMHCRLSPSSRLRDHLLWIVLMALVYRWIPSAKIRGAVTRRVPWIRALTTSTLVGDIRGGDSFSDIYGMRRFLTGFLMAWTVVLVKGHIVQLPQTYGPYRRWSARLLARYVLRRSSVVIARDKKSREVAQEMVGRRTNVLISPDVAFALAAVRPAEIDAAPPRELIGLNVNGLMYNGGYTRANMFGLTMDYPALLQNLVRELLSSFSGEVWLIPHTYGPPGHVESDNEAAAALYELLPGALRARVRLVTREYDQHEIKWLIARCKFFIGSRMHACIAALSQGIPCVGIAYSGKFAGVFATVAMEEWVVDARTIHNDEAMTRIMNLYRSQESVREGLMIRADAARDQLQHVFHQLLTNESRDPAEVAVARDREHRENDAWLQAPREKAGHPH